MKRADKDALIKQLLDITDFTAMRNYILMNNIRWYGEIAGGGFTPTIEDLKGNVRYSAEHLLLTNKPGFVRDGSIMVMKEVYPHTRLVTLQAYYVVAGPGYACLQFEEEPLPKVPEFSVFAKEQDRSIELDK